MLQNCSITAGCNSNNPLLNTTFCLLQPARCVYSSNLPSSVYFPLISADMTISKITWNKLYKLVYMLDYTYPK